MKKIIFIFVVMLISVSCIWAADKVIYYENDTLIQYDSLNFTIPHGYGPLNSSQNETTVVFINEKNESINITVGDKLAKGNHTMFGSHTGYLNKTNSTFTFSYVDSGKNVTVSARSQPIILKVLEG